MVEITKEQAGIVSPQATAPRLRGPSLGLLLLSLLWILVSLVGSVGVALEWADDYYRRGAVSVEWHALDHLTQGFLSLPSLVIAYGAWCMRRGRNCRLSIAAAVIACIPFLSPWVFLGIPFGIWALVVLLRRDVRAAFDDRR